MKALLYISIFSVGCFLSSSAPPSDWNKESLTNDINSTTKLSDSLASKIDDNSNGKVELEDINLDCQLMILEMLDFSSLVRMAEMNKGFLNLATDVFERKFAKKIVMFRPAFAIQNEKSNNAETHEVHLFLNALKFFGNFITTLGVNFEKLGKYQCFEIIKYIDQFATKSLKEFHMLRCNENYLADIQHPFEYIEQVSLDGVFDKLGSTTLHLNELFPNLRRLNVGSRGIVDKTSIDFKFSHLEHLNIIFGSSKGFRETDIVPMIQKNPQIKSITTGRNTMNFLRNLNQNLPNIEELNLPFLFVDYQDVGPEIVFHNVKKLTVKGKMFQQPDLLVFPQLSAFVVDCYPDFSNQWIDYTLRHPNLMELDIVGGSLENIHLAQLVGRLSNLVRGSIIISKDVEAETVVNFVESLEHLEKLQIKCYPSYLFAEEKRNAIVEQLSKNWTTRNDQDGQIIIERKPQL